MKKAISQSVILALLSGALVSACGVEVEAPNTPGHAEDMRTERQSAVEAEYAVIPLVPSAGSTYSAGQTVTIEWGLIVGTEGGRLLSDAIKLELYKGGQYHSTIAESLPLQQWTYAWTIPANITSGSLYSIRLSNVSNPSLVSYGDYFNIQGTGCDFRFDVASLYVARDQRTATYNYEGKLELAGMFSVGSVSTPRYPATGELSLSQGATLQLGLFITDVHVLAPTTVSVGAFLLEIEHGAQGNNDTGSIADSMAVSCTQSVVTKDLSVTLSDDSALEKEGRVVVKLRATRL